MLIDGGAFCEVRVRNATIGVFQQHGGSFAAAWPSGEPSEDLFGVKGTLLGPVFGSNNPESGRPPHN